MRGIDATQLAAVQAAAGMWGRAFAVASVEPATAATRMLTAPVLHDFGRSLVLQGESLYLIDSAPGGLRLMRASDWDITGVKSWQYRLTIAGPSGTYVRRVGADSVLHPRINQDASAPYRGQSPVKLSELTSGLAAHIERSLKREAAANTGYVVPAPLDGSSPDDLEALKGDIKTLRGRTALVPGMQRAWNDAGVGPGTANWRVQRIGSDPPETLVNLRSDAALAVLGACGIPPVLFDSRSDGTSLREGFRQFLHGCISGVAEIVAAELSEKLETDVRLNFTRLHAADIQGRGRAFASMIGTGVEGLPVDRAAELAGFK